MKILIADDDPVSLLYLQDALQDWGYEVVAVPDGRSAQAILSGADAPMLAILDWMMPGMDGIDLCRMIRGNGNDSYTYVIMLTSRTETAFIVEAMTAGADDFVSKPFHVEELEVRVRAGKRICELEQQLRLRASHDALTGIYNRGAIIDLLQKALARQRRERAGIALVFADLDHFKRINDEHGHLAGDAVLCEVSRRMARMLRPYDSLGRYGGEELMVVLPACGDDGALEVAERIRKAVCGAPVATDFGALPVSVSIGVAVLAPGADATLNQLIQCADQALYAAKNGGRNRVVLAP
ncbi:MULTISPECIES: GGDEF domain-containing protein [unclassified Janthinobacterium]|uniref:GGDEF domain-containing protein n=1 Tax=unclassified Janthinobacterium TaxID=2610881 RepID=UPI0003485EDC|nr:MULTISPECIES: diguanylate cyclase [unclassified Janthinobacterium]MEC5160194.1 two-component system cell cycle response regulator [Janthinobacterium sp. CG_S6]